MLNSLAKQKTTRSRRNWKIERAKGRELPTKKRESFK